MKTKTISSLFITTALLVLIPSIASAQSWSDPTGAPPTANASAPLNLSSSTQEKVGSLVLDNGLALVGGSLSVAPGNNLNVGSAYLSGTSFWTEIANNAWYDGSAWHVPNSAESSTVIQLSPTSAQLYVAVPGANIGDGVTAEVDHFGNTSDVQCVGGVAGYSNNICCSMNETTGNTSCDYETGNTYDNTVSWHPTNQPFTASTPGYYSLATISWTSGQSSSGLCRFNKLNNSSQCVVPKTSVTWASFTPPPF